MTICSFTYTLTYTRRYTPNSTFRICDLSNNHRNSCRRVDDERAHIATSTAEDGPGERRRGAHLVPPWIARTGNNSE